MQDKQTTTAQTCYGLFITATDTGAGKTWATLALMEMLRLQGLNVAGMKPVATGCEQIEYNLRNADACLIRKHATICHDYALINPYAFEPPAAPHIAAEHANTVIEFSRIAGAYRKIAAGADYVLVEGIGGWRVPLGQNRTLVDLVRYLDLPVVLVVGLRLGCINHTLLTVDSMHADKINLCGWLANSLVPDYFDTEKTLDFLHQHVSAPFLGILPYLPILDPGALAGHIDSRNLKNAIDASRFQRPGGLHNRA